jgi:hypothetical protein
VLEALGFFHVGCGHDHRHAGALGAQGLDQRPELAARERIDARRGLIEDQQVGVVHERAAQPKLLLHPAGELARRAFAKWRQAGGVEQAVDACPPFGGGLSEEPREEIDVFFHRQRRVQIAAEALRHEGHARRKPRTGRVVGDVLAQHAHLARLQALDPRDHGKQGRFAHAVRADQTDRATRRQHQVDMVERDRVAMAVRQA